MNNKILGTLLLCSLTFSFNTHCTSHKYNTRQAERTKGVHTRSTKGHLKETTRDILYKTRQVLARFKSLQQGRKGLRTIQSIVVPYLLRSKYIAQREKKLLHKFKNLNKRIDNAALIAVNAVTNTSSTSEETQHALEAVQIETSNIEHELDASSVGTSDDGGHSASPSEELTHHQETVEDTHAGDRQDHEGTPPPAGENPQPGGHPGPGGNPDPGFIPTPPGPGDEPHIPARLTWREWLSAKINALKVLTVAGLRATNEFVHATQTPGTISHKVLIVLRYTLEGALVLTGFGVTQLLYDLLLHAFILTIETMTEDQKISFICNIADTLVSLIATAPLSIATLITSFATFITGSLVARFFPDRHPVRDLFNWLTLALQTYSMYTQGRTVASRLGDTPITSKEELTAQTKARINLITHKEDIADVAHVTEGEASKQLQLHDEPMSQVRGPGESSGVITRVAPEDPQDSTHLGVRRNPPVIQTGVKVDDVAHEMSVDGSAESQLPKAVDQRTDVVMGPASLEDPHAATLGVVRSQPIHLDMHPPAAVPYVIMIDESGVEQVIRVSDDSTSVIMEPASLEDPSAVTLGVVKETGQSGMCYPYEAPVPPALPAGQSEAKKIEVCTVYDAPLAALDSEKCPVLPLNASSPVPNVPRVLVPAFPAVQPEVLFEADARTPVLEDTGFWASLWKTGLEFLEKLSENNEENNDAVDAFLRLSAL
jgi:hypothetical protein